MAPTNILWLGTAQSGKASCLALVRISFFRCRENLKILGQLTGDAVNDQPKNRQSFTYKGKQLQCWVFGGGASIFLMVGAPLEPVNFLSSGACVEQLSAPQR